MSETPKEFQMARLRYGTQLLQALMYFLEDDWEANTVCDGAFEQAGRQWVAIEGEANVLHVIARAAQDQCALLLPRAFVQPPRQSPTAAQIIRHIEWFEGEKRLNQTAVAISVRRASLREEGLAESDDSELEALQAQYDELAANLFRVKLGLEDDDGPAGGGVACEVPVPPPHRGPGGGRTFEEALTPARNP